MDRSTAKALRDKLNAIFAEHGIDGFEIEVGNASYDSARCTFKVEVREQGAGTKEEGDLETFANLSGLDTTKVANQQGKSFTLVGFKTKARKNPWIIQDLKTGSRYVIADDTAKRWFGKDVA